MHTHGPRPHRFRVAIKALPSNVRGHRNFDRQRPPEESEYIRPLDRAANAKDIPGNTDAATHFSLMGTSCKAAATADSAYDKNFRPVLN